MEDFFTIESDMLQSQGQIDGMQEETEQAPPISYIDFFARDSEVNMVPNVVDQSDIRHIDFFAPENQLNDVPEHVVDQPVEQSHIPCIDFFARHDETNYVADNVANQPAEQPIDNQLFYDFFNIENQLNSAANVAEQSVWNTGYNALDNQPSAGAHMVEHSVQERDYYSLEGRMCPAANIGEQSIPDIDHIPLANQLNAASDAPHQSVWNDYYNLQNHWLSAAANGIEQSAPENQLCAAGNYYVGEQSIPDTDNIATENEVRAAPNVIEQSARDSDYIDMENQPSVEQSSMNYRLMEENADSHNDGPSDHDEDAMSEFEQLPDDDPPFDEHPASRSVVMNLASVIFIQGYVERDGVACAVCQDEFKVGDMAKKLPCSHYYHDDCILPWLDTQNTCPVCRYQLPVDNDSDDEGDEENE